MFLLSTTNGWNLGDDLIREGVLKIIGLDKNKSIIWLNRSQVRVKTSFPSRLDGILSNFTNKYRIYYDDQKKTKCLPLFKLQNNYPSSKSLVKSSEGVIIAGTPAWIESIKPIYKFCITFKIPVYLIGVGRGASYHSKYLLNRLNKKKLIKGATARDLYAKKFLETIRIKTKIFLDPAIHANYCKKTTKDIDLIFTPLLNKKYQYFYYKLYKKIEDKISIISVHEPYEYIIAKKLFKKPIFFNSDYRAYKNLYSRTRLYIGGRSHGAIPVLGSGGYVHLIKHKKKQIMFNFWLEEMRKLDLIPTVKLYSPKDIDKIKIEKKNDGDISILISKDLRKQKEYWREKFK